MKVLLIEDNEDDAVLIREMLREDAWHTIQLVWKDCLAAGLEEVSQGEYDVVLVDLKLPDCQGAGAFLQVQERAPDVPVIVLTGLDDETVALAAVHAGAQDYLLKKGLTGELLKKSIRYSIEREKTVKKLRWYADALRRKEAHLSEIIDNLRDGILVVEQDGTVRFANPAAAAVLGRGEAELIGSQVELPSRTEGSQEIEFPVPGGEPVTREVEVAKIEWEGQEAFLITLH